MNVPSDQGMEVTHTSWDIALLLMRPSHQRLSPEGPEEWPAQSGTSWEKQVSASSEHVSRWLVSSPTPSMSFLSPAYHSGQAAQEPWKSFCFGIVSETITHSSYISLPSNISEGAAGYGCFNILLARGRIDVFLWKK